MNATLIGTSSTIPVETVPASNPWSSLIIPLSYLIIYGVPLAIGWLKIRQMKIRRKKEDDEEW